MGSIAAVWVGSEFAGMPALPSHRAGDRRGLPGRSDLGGHRRRPEGDRRRQRGDLDDHAQLHRDLRRAVPVRTGRAAPERHRSQPAGLQRRRRGGTPAGVLGRSGAAGASHRAVHRAGGGGRVLAHPQPLDHRLRGARRRPQSRGRPLRRNERVEELPAGHGASAACSRAWPGALDILGWQFRVATNDIEVTQLGFLGIAVALLGRNTAIGTVAAALLFGALLSGTSQRNLDPTIFEPELASNLTFDHPGPRRARRQRRRARARRAEARAGRVHTKAWQTPRRGGGRRRERRHPGRVALGDRGGPARLVRRRAAARWPGSSRSRRC